MIHIFENEWDNNRNVVKSVILKKLNLVKECLPFEDLSIKSIDRQLVNSFMSLNDMREIKSSKYKLGFFYNNKLTMVCSFDIKNKNLFIRNFCKSIKCRILNLHKMFDYLKCRYKVKDIYLIDDLRYNYYSYINTGNKCNYIKPTYWYYNKNKKKTELHNKNIINSINNEDQKSYIKVWDCGYLKIKI